MATLHQEMAQATAHTLRPIPVTHQAASTVARLSNVAKNVLQNPSEFIPEGGDLALFIWAYVQQVKELAHFSLTAAADALTVQPA